MTVGKFVNVKEAAAIIGCSDSRVRQLLLDGVLEGIKATERAWLINAKDVERYRDSDRKPGRKTAE